MQEYGRIFHGIFVYVWTSALKSRFLYVYLITTILGVSAVYGIAALGSNTQVPVAEVVYADGMRNNVSSFCSILIFLTIFSASRIFPRMLDPGMSGFFFGRPYSRRTALALTTLASALTYSAIILICGGVFIACYLLWSPIELSTGSLILQLGLEALVYLLYLPVLLFFGVYSRSGSYAFLGTFAIWLIAYILSLRAGALRLLGDDLAQLVGDVLYYILPKSNEISKLFSIPGATDLMPLWSSALFALVLYALADWKLRRIDL